VARAVTSIDLLRAAFEWLPVLFAVDLVLFHLVADHPLALRSWWRRSDRVETESGLA
jgi:hypothetical protein